MVPPTGFTVEVSEAGGRVTVVALGGRLDPLAAEDLRTRFEELYQAGSRRFVLDLAGLKYLGSVGIQVFLQLVGRVKGEGAVCLFGATPMVREVLDLVRIGTVVQSYPTRRAAVDAAAIA